VLPFRPASETACIKFNTCLAGQYVGPVQTCYAAVRLDLHSPNLYPPPDFGPFELNIGIPVGECPRQFWFLHASVLVQHVRDILELTHSKNFLKMSNLETLLLLLKI